MVSPTVTGLILGGRAMGMIDRAVVAGILTLSAACAGEPDGPPAPTPDAAAAAAWKAEGAALIEPFKQELQAALRGALADGASAAIRVCQSEAPAIAERRGDGPVRLGRTSHKLRNPGNAPPDWAAPLLAGYRAGERRGAGVVALPGGRVGYVEPITVQPACLACHGESLSEPVAARLAELYPHDQATGFAAGDFRGLFWAEFPTPATP
jgi:hypothetical protein